jgi:hypothetical protein
MCNVRCLKVEHNIEEWTDAEHFLVHCQARLFSEPDNILQNQASILAEQHWLA